MFTEFYDKKDHVTKPLFTVVISFVFSLWSIKEFEKSSWTLEENFHIPARLFISLRMCLVCFSIYSAFLYCIFLS